MREDGASTVVSATLVLSLAVLMFIVFSSTQLPQWIEDREQNHGLQVKEDLSAFQSKLLQVTAADLGRTISTDVSLAPEPIAMLQRGKATGQLSFIDETGIDLQMTNEALVANGAALANTPDGALATWNDANVVHSLVLRINVNTAPADATGVIATFSDGTNSVQASFVHVGPNANSPCSGYALVATLSVPARNLPLQCGVSDTGTFDLDMFDALPLQAALGNLQRPMTVSFSNNATSASAGAVWYNVDGLPQSVGTPIPGSFDVLTNVGTIAYLPNYINALREDVRLEGGALTAEQAGGAAMLSSVVRLTTDGTSGLLQITLLDMTGSGSISGDGSASIHVTPTALLDSLYLVQDVELTTTATEAWGRAFEDELYLSGVNGTATVGETSQLSVDPLTWWVHVRIIEADVELT